MTPRGTLAYLVGVIILVSGAVLTGMFVAFSTFLEPIQRSLAMSLVLPSIVIVFAALHLMGAGLYRMLVHLFAAISRTDPASDRRLRGRTLYVMGQIGIAMALPTVIVFLFAANASNVQGEREVAMLVGVLPGGLVLLTALTVYWVGLGIMVRDIFLRHRDIMDKREAERKRRLDETGELQTEVIPLAHPADVLRLHIKEDRG